MKLVLKLSSSSNASTPPRQIYDENSPSVEEKAIDANNKENTIQNCIEEGKTDSGIRGLRPRKPISYFKRLEIRQKINPRKSETPIKTEKLSILPLPLGEISERVELEERLKQLEALDIQTMVLAPPNNHSNNKNNGGGVRYIMHRGLMVREGDYVAVRGEDERVYFAIVYDLFFQKNHLQSSGSGWPEKLMKLRWLLPKALFKKELIGDPSGIRPEHFDLGPMHSEFEKIDNVLAIFYSPTCLPFETLWVNRTIKQLRPAPIYSDTMDNVRRSGLRERKSVGRTEPSPMMRDLEAAHILQEMNR
jgi:hypothetical protein